MLCRSCYHDVPAGSASCPRCGARQGEARPPVVGDGGPPPVVPAGPGARAPAAATGGNPWEELGERGFFPAFGETLQQSLFHPAEFFRRTSTADRAGAALLYAMLVGTVSLAVALLWQRAMGYAPQIFEGRERVPLSVALLAVPLGFALWSLLVAGMLHVSLLVVGGARAGVTATLKAVTYAYSAMAFTVLPVCGAPIGIVWFVVIGVVGLRELHRISTGRAVAAWLLPFVLATCFAVAGAALFAAALAKIWMQLGGAAVDL